MRGRLLLAATLLSVAACSAGPPPPRAVDGTLDLTGYELRGHPISMGGRWQFWWDQTVTDDPLAYAPAPDDLVQLTLWRRQRSPDGRKLGPYGWATYRVSVKLPEETKLNGEPMALQLPEAQTALRVVVRDSEGKLLASGTSGSFATEPARSAPSYRLDTIHFTATADLVITLYVSNWESARGGIYHLPLLGRAADVDPLLRRTSALDWAVVGLLLITTVYHLMTYALRLKDRAPLWFALLCLDIGVRNLVTGHLTDAWTTRSLWPITPRLSYLTFYVAIPLTSAFMRTLFPRYALLSVHQAIVAIASPFILVSLFGSPYQFTSTLVYYQIFALVSILWALVLWFRAIVEGRDRLALVSVLGFLLFCGTAVNDMAVAQSVIRDGMIMGHYGAAIFVASQTLVLAIQRERDRRELDRRAAEVQALNQSLRRQIADRSRQLQEALLLVEARAPDDLVAGQLFVERYRIERALGAGGMGKVYEATRVADNRRVALKLLRGHWDPEALARFAREAELAARIDHPHVVSVFDFDVAAQGEIFIAMELVTGDSLDKQRDRFGDVAWATLLLRQLADALVTIHGQGILHRDLKPANILIDDTGQLKVSDFGIAGLSAIPTDKDAEAAALTTIGSVLGTPQYMAPELAQGVAHASPQSDVFSFGLIAYEILTGQKPWATPVVRNRAAGHTPSAPPPVGTVARVEPRFGDLVDRCIHLDPSQRPDASTVKQVIDSL